MAATPFQIQPRLTQIAMAVKPEGMIADQVCPRINVEGDKFIYTKSNTEDLFTVPDTHVGRKSAPNEVDFGAHDVTDKVEDYALDDFVPQCDIEKAAAAHANFDPLAQATEGVAILIDLGREKRVADMYQDLNTFAPALRTTLSGIDQWSDHDNSEPYSQITAAFDGMLVAPNIAVMGRVAWRQLRTHPEMVARALNRKGGNGGVAAKGSLSKEQVAELLELDDIFVGEAFVNLARKGQTPAMSQLWGNHASFLRIDKNVRTVQGFAMPTFAFTAEFGQRFSGTIPDSKRGIRGGQTVRVGEQVKELVSFIEAGYHFHNAVA